MRAAFVLVLLSSVEVRSSKEALVSMTVQPTTRKRRWHRNTRGLAGTYPSDQVQSDALAQTPHSALYLCNNAVGTSVDSAPRRVVMKFGGSSLADSGRVIHIAKLIQEHIAGDGVAPIIVCSAMGSTTNRLIEAGKAALGGKVLMEGVRSLHQAACDELQVSFETRREVAELLGGLEKLLSGVMLLGELSPRTRDLLVSYGERLSVRLVAAQLNLIGVPAQAFDAWDLGLVTTSDFGGAEVLVSCYPDIKRAVSEALAEGACAPGYATRRAGLGETLVPVVTGFIGKDVNDHVTTLGRGGSDLTAAVLAAACAFDEIEVWKDVDGMLTADPRVVPTAVPVPAVSFEEASELAYFGAKILHPISMQPAMRASICVRIKNSYNPSHPGTLITEDKQALAALRRGASGNTRSTNSTQLVTAITTKEGQVLVDIVSTRMLGQHGFLAKVFAVFEEHKVSVDVVATSEVSVSLTIGADEESAAVAKVVRSLSRGRSSQQVGSDSGGSSGESGGEPVAEVEVKRDRAILSLIADVSRSSDVMADVFKILAAEGIQVEMLSQGASKVNISLVLKSADLAPALRVLHAHFFAHEVAAAGRVVLPQEK